MHYVPRASQPSRDKGKAPFLPRTNSPPPILRITPLENHSHPPGDQGNPHQMAVDRVNAALALKAPDEDDPGPLSDAVIGDEDEVGDEEMFEEEDEIDDLMTLDQY